MQLDTQCYQHLTELSNINTYIGLKGIICCQYNSEIYIIYEQWNVFQKPLKHAAIFCSKSGASVVKNCLNCTSKAATIEFNLCLISKSHIAEFRIGTSNANNQWVWNDHENYSHRFVAEHFADVFVHSFSSIWNFRFSGFNAWIMKYFLFGFCIMMICLRNMEHLKCYREPTTQSKMFMKSIIMMNRKYFLERKRGSLQSFSFLLLQIRSDSLACLFLYRNFTFSHSHCTISKLKLLENARFNIDYIKSIWCYLAERKKNCSNFHCIFAEASSSLLRFSYYFFAFTFALPWIMRIDKNWIVFRVLLSENRIRVTMV